MINLRDMESLKAEPDEQTSQMHISIPSPSPALHVHPPTLVPASISGHLDTEMVEAAVCMFLCV